MARDIAAEREWLERKLAEIEAELSRPRLPIWVPLIGGLIAGPALFAAGALVAKYLL